MQRITGYFILVLSLVFISLDAAIVEVNRVEEIFPHFFDNDLVIFDVDMVLIQPSDPAFRMSNMKRYSAICKKVMKEIPAEKQMLFLGLTTISSEPTLIHPDYPKVLQELESKGVLLMGLTANLTGEFSSVASMEKLRVASLKKLGIDFSKASPNSCCFTFNELASFRDNFCTYMDGILFVNGTAVTKGEALLAFFKRAKLSPKKILFIDDKKENLESVESALNSLNCQIEFQGIHYQGAKDIPSPELTEEEFEKRWREVAKEALLIS